MCVPRSGSSPTQPPTGCSLVLAFPPRLVFPRGHLENATNLQGAKHSTGRSSAGGDQGLSDLPSALPHHTQDRCEAAPGEEPSLGSQASMSRATSHGINWIFKFFFFCSAAHLCLKTFPVKIIPWHGQEGEFGAQQLPGGLAEVVSSRCP